MSQPTAKVDTSTGTSGSTAKADASPATRSGSTPALNEEGALGKTTIASSVVQKIAGIATREVSGIHALGGGVSRAFGAIRERIPGSGTSSTSGVAVEVGEKQAAVDLDVVVEYGARIVDVARSVRRNVITTVEQITGLQVIEVNIAVHDIHLPDEESEEEAGPTRVE